LRLCGVVATGHQTDRLPNRHSTVTVDITGMRADTMTELDDLLHITPWVSVQPGEYAYAQRKAGVGIDYDLYFETKPAWVELRDIWGRGVRWEGGVTTPVACKTAAAVTTAAGAAGGGASAESFIIKQQPSSGAGSIMIWDASICVLLIGVMVYDVIGWSESRGI